MTDRDISAPLHLAATTPDSALVATLHRELSERWTALNMPSFSPLPRSFSPQLPEYQVAAVPAALRGRRAELIVEASDAPAIAAAVASKAAAIVLDFDDTFSPTPANVQAAYAALPAIAAATNRNAQALLARPRALYAHVSGAQPARSATLDDLAALLSARPELPLPLYIPKLETPAQAQFWDDALSLCERELGWPPFSVPVCLQIETWPGLLCADELLHTLRRRAYGLNAGRWDYVFSLVKSRGEGAAPMPTRARLSMDQESVRAYAETLVRLARRRGAEAIGGSAALAPDPADPSPVLARVQADKRREARQGFTAAWAGLPELLGAVEAGFANVQPEPLPYETPARTLERLLNLPAPEPLRLDAVQDTIGLALDVFAAWYAGRGVIVRRGSTEDTATAELARALIWQWIRSGAEIEGGEYLSRERYLSERRALCSDGAPQARLLDALVLCDPCPAYFPRFAQQLEQQSGQP